jgi:hypothetical protein
MAATGNKPQIEAANTVTAPSAYVEIPEERPDNRWASQKRVQ